MFLIIMELRNQAKASQIVGGTCDTEVPNFQHLGWSVAILSLNLHLKICMWKCLLVYSNIWQEIAKIKAKIVGQFLKNFCLCCLF